MCLPFLPCPLTRRRKRRALLGRARRRSLWSSGRLLRQSGGDDGHGVDLLGVAAAAEVVDGGIQAQQDGAVGVKAAQTLGDLVADVARVDVGEDEGVGVAGHGGAGELQLAHGGDTAASNCISPSTGISGHECLGLLAGVAHLVHIFPLPEPLVE